MPRRFLFVILAALAAIPGYSADIVFGRRVYAVQGRSYQQIWTLDTHTRKIAALTSSERRHAQPACSPDGKRIWFLSGAFGDEKDTELWSYDPASRTEKLAAQFKGRIERLLGGTDTRAFFTAYEENQPALYRWDGNLTRLSPVGSSVMTAAALSADARSLAVETGDTGTVTLMEPSGAPGRTVDHCASPVWSSDARKLACVAGNAIRVVNQITGVESARVEFTQRTTPPVIADFSPDGTRLLVKTVGANHSSTYPQSDYWVLAIASRKWTFVGPGQSALFAPGGDVLVVTPRDLVTVGKAHEWVSRMLLVDPATHAQTPVAGGTASDVEPCRCGPVAAAAVRRAPAKRPRPAGRKR